MKSSVSYFVTAGLSSLITLVLIFSFRTELRDFLYPPETVTRAGSTPSASSASPVPHAAGDSTTREYRQQIEELKLEVAWLQSIIEQLGDGSTGQDLTPKKRPVRFAQPETRELWFDESALLEAGLDARDFNDIKRRFEKNELEKLELINRASAEDWAGNARLFKALMKKEEQFKNSLTPREYDIALYASGRPNRLQVTDVLDQSAAGIAGIKAGDIILNYGGKPILNRRDLEQATARGTEGEMITVNVLRGDETVTTYVPRGVLGTRFKSVARPPQ